ncbi:hypothetical protein G7Y79_00049g085210 [Physcia stellaris]|nr:hypothetical protein G7Y79_00049g085210 [Physcia stellaris]
MASGPCNAFYLRLVALSIMLHQKIKDTDPVFLRNAPALNSPINRLLMTIDEVRHHDYLRNMDDRLGQIFLDMWWLVLRWNEDGGSEIHEQRKLNDLRRQLYDYEGYNDEQTESYFRSALGDQGMMD